MRFIFPGLALWRTLPTWANVEKVIFLTPAATTNSLINLAVFDVAILSPSERVINRRLPVAFANSTDPLGTTTWLQLEALTGQQRYEVRVCWAATQPTSFNLHIFDQDRVSQILGLVSSSSAVVHSGRSFLVEQENTDPPFDPIIAQAKDDPSVQLFLRISAAADYFTTDKSLMQSVPAVNVDIILDPYLCNIFPESLLPTALYLIIIAIGAWFLSDQIWCSLRKFAQSSEQPNISSHHREPPSSAKKKS